jgi:hypothetical protein
MPQALSTGLQGLLSEPEPRQDVTPVFGSGTHDVARADEIGHTHLKHAMAKLG